MKQTRSIHTVTLGFIVFLIHIVVTSSAMALTFSGVSLDQHTLNLNAKQSVHVRFHLDASAKVTLSVFDERDLLIRRIDKQLDQGDHHIAWDGLDNGHQPVSSGVYFYTLKAQTKKTTTEFDLTELTGGERVEVTDITWHDDAQQIRYRLQQPSRLVMRIGLKNRGPLLKTLIDWQAKDAGEHRQAWDGWDASNTLNLSHHEGIEFAADAFSLPDNHILVSNAKTTQAYLEKPAWGTEYRTKKRDAPKRIYAPHRQLPEQRGDFPLQLSLIDDAPKDADGVPIVSGEVAIRLNVPQAIDAMASKRFEPVFFVDGQFVFENEVGFFPMTFVWDSTKHTPGIHYVTANMRGYLSNFGMATLKLRIKPTAKTANTDASNTASATNGTE